MKKLIIALAVTLTSGFVMADGFVCETSDGLLKIKVYNYVNAANGTRVPARMVLSNPAGEVGNKTIAVFNAESGTLEVAADSAASSNTIYTGKVDLRFAEQSAKEALVLGEKLADLAIVSLAVDFKYGDNLAKGEQAEALVTIEKRSGGELREQAVCTRYKKGE